jgi:hypothetical protein
MQYWQEPPLLNLPLEQGAPNSLSFSTEARALTPAADARHIGSPAASLGTRTEYASTYRIYTLRALASL